MISSTRQPVEVTSTPYFSPILSLFWANFGLIVKNKFWLINKVIKGGINSLFFIV